MSASLSRQTNLATPLITHISTAFKSKRLNTGQTDRNVIYWTKASKWSMDITYNSFSVELTLAEATTADFLRQVVIIQAHNNTNIISILNKQVTFCGVLKSDVNACLAGQRRVKQEVRFRPQ